ncbi:hypothetical protein PV433_11575 [Paenibacillus sp. GYB004]|uniref:hypothetical protein n=1 Tax=Paenibacillus sp. GYB004 TaxID=2994393 RepID=UPI002F962410
MSKYVICDTAEYDNNTMEYDTWEEAYAAFSQKIKETNPNWKGKLFIAEIKEVSVFPKFPY